MVVSTGGTKVLKAVELSTSCHNFLKISQKKKSTFMF